jgi:hypothetical protein
MCASEVPALGRGCSGPLQLIASAEWSLLLNANGPDDNRPTTAALRSIASLDISGDPAPWPTVEQ